MQQIRYFLAVAETRNFTLAAERCNISQPALTRAIKALETELGAPLVNREHRNTHLTELGRLMEPYFRNIVEQSQSAKSAASEFMSLDKATLKIGAMCTIGPSIIADFVASFAREYANVDVAVNAFDLKELQERLIKGELEVGFLSTPKPVDDNFHTLPLFDERFVVATSLDHPFAKISSVSCEALNGEPYVNRANCEYYESVSEAFAERGIAMRQIFSSECDEWVAGMVRAGLGVGFFTEFSIKDPAIALRPLIDPEFSRTIAIATVRGRPHSPAIGAFVRLARLHCWPRPSPAKEASAAPQRAKARAPVGANERRVPVNPESGRRRRRPRRGRPALTPQVG